MSRTSNTDVIGRFPLGSRAGGPVVRILSFGVHFDLGDGIVGFLDGAGMAEAWEEIPEQHTWPQIGDMVEGVVIDVTVEPNVQVRITWQRTVLDAADSDTSSVAPLESGPDPFPNPR